MQIVLETNELNKEIDRESKSLPELKEKLWKALRTVSLETERAVKKAVPIDTGRARASWGNWSDALRMPQRGVRGKPLAAQVRQVQEAGEGDSIYQEDEANLKITQGSNLEYIEILNSGHSKQAPAGFIDVRAEQALQLLEQEIDVVLREV